MIKARSKNILTVAITAIVTLVLVFSITAGAQEDIGLDKAKETAFTHAGVDAANANVTKSELEFDGRYDIEFYVDGVEYDVEVDAKTGNVVEFDVDGKRPNSEGKTDNTAKITLEEAKEAALKHAGLKAADVTFTEAKVDDGHYDVDFYTGDKKYDYEISAADGKVLGYDVETRKNAQTTDNTANDANTTKTAISLSEAKNIALKNAGVAEADAKFTEAKKDGRHYDIDFYANGVEYDYEISVSDGKILEKSTEKERDNVKQEQTSEDIISSSKAKSIALKHAGVSASDADYVRVSKDIDDGRTVYEVDFKCGGYEYDYEINAKTGSIIEYDKDIDD